MGAVAQSWLVSPGISPAFSFALGLGFSLFHLRRFLSWRLKGQGFLLFSPHRQNNINSATVVITTIAATSGNNNNSNKDYHSNTYSYLNQIPFPELPTGYRYRLIRGGTESHIDFPDLSIDFGFRIPILFRPRHSKRQHSTSYICIRKYFFRCLGSLLIQEDIYSHLNPLYRSPNITDGIQISYNSKSDLILESHLLAPETHIYFSELVPLF